MTNLTEREKAFEAKYQHDQEVAFKVNVRRNKLLGLWAADLMGLAKDEAAAYAKIVVQADFEKRGDRDVLERVLKDLTSRGVDMSEHRVRKEMDRLLEVAKAEIMKETS
ncbi:MAG TPA: DUF1476 domain-containing protein [Alphaproteobacteria bacterium]|jgi:hypothetical protein|nr:DUF1476 domain-containing protein [Alphaproteobacteria bacterium]